MYRESQRRNMLIINETVYFESDAEFEDFSIAPYITIEQGATSVPNGDYSDPAHMTANSEARHAALMFEQEAKVPYVYAPKKPQGDPTQNSKNKKKK